MDIKKVVGGLRYDTTKAETVCRHERGYPRDFEYEDTTLYRTSGSRFFLAGEGGARSRWAERVSGGLQGGEGLIPVTVEEAREFAERYADAETVERFFEVEDA
ncbi:hypothetical protein [Aureimonas sp. AU40]|uniref:hypothetical protein n=1 Tax=Aureimonas sp. AU40 TaxID=1637747 RepID=UPI0007845D78|nr:hypothetical protein [Aureimonas sp. AU40]